MQGLWSGMLRYCVPGYIFKCPERLKCLRDLYTVTNRITRCPYRRAILGRYMLPQWYLCFEWTAQRRGCWQEDKSEKRSSTPERTFKQPCWEKKKRVSEEKKRWPAEETRFPTCDRRAITSETKGFWQNDKSEKRSTTPGRIFKRPCWEKKKSV